jgi:hypothetical protein
VTGRFGIAFYRSYIEAHGLSDDGLAMAEQARALAMAEHPGLVLGPIYIENDGRPDVVCFYADVVEAGAADA